MKTRENRKKAPPSLAGVPAKWQWHYQRLQSLRETLMGDHNVQATEVTETIEPHSMDDADSATDEIEHDLALGILAHEEDMLYEVDAAIERILNRTYGICEATGKTIPDRRLRVVPWTRYTKEALEKIERQHRDDRPHLSEVSSIQGPAPGGLPEAPEPEDLMSVETARRRQREEMNDFEGEDQLNITPDQTIEP